ncbi:hypothetical protein LJR027_003906 [Terrabacter sp. LjRoot27]|uniref:hypothetical protein n=1 Tax=Terrabacter sp. LjRoot27 TaxID=3342306 RepID=UPI003ED0FC6E
MKSSRALEKSILREARKHERKAPDSAEATLLMTSAWQLQKWRSSLWANFWSPDESIRTAAYAATVVANGAPDPHALIMIAKQLSALDDDATRGEFLQLRREHLPDRILSVVQHLTWNEVLNRVGASITLAWLLFGIVSVLVALKSGARPFTDYSP